MLKCGFKGFCEQMFIYTWRLVFFLFSVFNFSFYFFFNGLFIFDFPLLNLCGVDFRFTFIVDFFSILFRRVVLLIRGVIFIYSIEYIGLNYDFKRFFVLLFLFVMSMMILVFRPNLISIMLGWDGLGLTSFCLVIYYQNFSSLSSGLITILTNRIGDVGVIFLISFFI